MHTFEHRSEMPVSAAALFAYHARPGALERLFPPWLRARVIERSGGIRDGDRLVIRMKVGPFHRTWVAVHHDYIEGQQFVDTQESGPFARWAHTHRFPATSANSSTLVDHVEYQLPSGAIGNALGRAYVRRQLDRMFHFRHVRTMNDLRRHAKFRDRPPMRIAMTGGSGIVGSNLEPFLTTAGHSVQRLVRRAGINSSDISWNVQTGEVDVDRLRGVDALVHLAGRNIAVRWTKRHRREIWDSRIPATEKLCRTLAAMKDPPKTLITASGIGYYGDRGDELLTETSDPGAGFTAEICKAWEAATEPARHAGIRVVNLRIGVALSAKGGALAKLLTPARLGFAGRVGNGRQYLSWIALDDLVGLIYHVLMTATISGPINAVAPTPVPQMDFIRTLGRIVHRPTVMPMPNAAVHLLFGQMGRELLLSSAKVSPAAAIATGFEFLHPDLEQAMRLELGT